MAKNITEIDKKSYYKKECQPLVDELLKKCVLGGIPVFITAAIRNHEDGTEYKNDAILPASRNIGLKEDHLKYHLMVANGCKAVPVKTADEFCLDEEAYFRDVERLGSEKGSAEPEEEYVDDIF